MLKIAFARLDVRYGAREVFCNFSLELNWEREGQGNSVGLMGMSGSGKSTLLRLLLDPSERPAKGRAIVEPGAVVISYVPQTPVLFVDRTIRDNASYLRDAGAYRHQFSEKLVQDWADRLGMSSFLNSRASVERLSGGEKQRLMLLRALSVRPTLLLLDEPCSGLDPVVRQEFLGALRDVIATEQLFVLYVSHHWSEVSLICDRVAFLHTDMATRCTRRATVQDTGKFALWPPTIDAAKFVSEPHLNVLPAARTAADRFVVTDDQNPEAYIAFPAVALADFDATRIRYETVRTQALFTTLRLRATKLLVNLRTADSKIATDGGAWAWVYDREKTIIGAGRLSEDSRGLPCLQMQS